MRLKPESCDEVAINSMVQTFYDRVRQDEHLGPVFARHVKDWPQHLATMVDFWSSVLLGTRRYHGLPMPVHQALPELSEALFARWLELFHASTAEVCGAVMRERADLLAERIAQSLWQGHPLSRTAAGLARKARLPSPGRTLPLVIREADPS